MIWIVAPSRKSKRLQPLIQIRRAKTRGHTDYGWLKSSHTFSFGDYYDPAHMGFRSLRVINDDRVMPGQGFGTHPHRDMEIFSYVIEGALEHKDSMGNGRVLRPGEIQLMTAGRGVTHSEFNPSPSQLLHFLQIWIQPRERGLAPDYTEWRPPADPADASQVLIISPDGSRRLGDDSSGCEHLSHPIEIRANGRARSARRPGSVVAGSRRGFNVQRRGPLDR